MNQIIYLDNNSTTKVDPRVVDSMIECLSSNYGNASSSHLAGRSVNLMVRNAQKQLANLLKCSSNELVFTSGATESINLAIRGIAEAYKSKGQHIITCQTEHTAVIETCKYLETIGFDITYLPVGKDGLVNPVAFENAFRSDTVLACIMLVNNETGVIQPIKDLVDISHRKGAIFFTDATQAVGKLPLDVTDLGIDLLCLSGHKFYGPKGIGALYIKSKFLKKITRLIHGGNQQSQLRGGTLNVPGIIGMGIAAEISMIEMENNKERIGKLRDYLEEELLKSKGVSINGSNKSRVYNVTNIFFEGIDADSVITESETIMVSNGSACTSELIEPSHVLMAMGLTSEQAFSSIRFSFGKFNTKEEVEVTLEYFKNLLNKREHI